MVLDPLWRSIQRNNQRHLSSQRQPFNQQITVVREPEPTLTIHKWQLKSGDSEAIEMEYDHVQTNTLRIDQNKLMTSLHNVPLKVFTFLIKKVILLECFAFPTIISSSFQFISCSSFCEDCCLCDNSRVSITLSCLLCLGQPRTLEFFRTQFARNGLLIVVQCSTRFFVFELKSDDLLSCAMVNFKQKSTNTHYYQSVIAYEPDFFRMTHWLLLTFPFFRNQ